MESLFVKPIMIQYGVRRNNMRDYSHQSSEEQRKTQSTQNEIEPKEIRVRKEMLAKSQTRKSPTALPQDTQKQRGKLERDK